MTVDQWNELVPPGTPVRYFHVRNETKPWFGGQDGIETRTRSEAWSLGCSGRAIVKVEGIAGGVDITHVFVDAERMLRECEAVIRENNRGSS